MTRAESRLVIAQSLDWLTFSAFVVLVPVSVHAERNPLIAGAYALGGVAAVGLLKVGLALVAARRRPSRPVAGWYMPLRTVLLSCAAASGIVGAGFNSASLIDALARGGLR